ncbi:MAG TPA: hypothetical protein VNO81_02300 [Candidatus Nitrosotenuis sp.]|jgi:hypothetical protein|nr:hypothetical protein [Candidatus Nitrosotenuis sp.]
MTPALAERPLTEEVPSFTIEEAQPSEALVTLPYWRVKVEPWAPEWVQSCLQRIRGFLDHEEGWDSYDGRPLTKEALRKGLAVLAFIEAYGLPAPFVAPTSSGGILFEWQREDIDAQLEVGPGGEVSLYLLRPDGSEEEIPDQEDVTVALDKLSAEMRCYP